MQSDLLDFMLLQLFLPFYICLIQSHVDLESIKPDSFISPSMGFYVNSWHGGFIFAPRALILCPNDCTN